MASAGQREEWAALQAAAPKKPQGKPSPADIAALKAHSATSKAFLSALSPEATLELTGKQKAAEVKPKEDGADACASVRKNTGGQLFDYFLVVDFEATCNEDQRGVGALTPQEIIEFPVALLNSATLEVESTFRAFVKPVVHPALTAFCTELTGVTQAQVDAGLDLRDALSQLERWMEHHCLDMDVVPQDKRRSFIFVSCGDWDLNHLRSQCKKQQLPEPSWARRVCNLKFMYEKVLGTCKVGMTGMLEGLGLPHVGKHHCGIDDVRNITAVLQRLAQQITIEPTAGSRLTRAFLGPTNAVLGLVPRDFTPGACPASPPPKVDLSAGAKGGAKAAPAQAAKAEKKQEQKAASPKAAAKSSPKATKDAKLSPDQLNDHFSKSSYLSSTSGPTLRDYKLCTEIASEGVDPKKHPHTHRWLMHIQHLQAVYGQLDWLGRPLESGEEV